MKIIMITPAPPGSRAGNRATAERWARLLENLGHQVEVVTAYGGQPCDLFIALHAWRSHEAIRAFRDRWPAVPLILALTGTDIYRHQAEYPQATTASMAEADALIGLHALVARDIPEEFADKLVTLYQSASPIAHDGDRQEHDPDAFTVCVIGHLREEKDSLRAALAARLLPEGSRICIVNAGKPHTPEWQMKAELEIQGNPRFRWLGELDKAETDRLLAQSRLMVISSVMEGGANVVSEACRAGLPILASDIPGNRGLLGDDYDGYFPAGDQARLAQMLHRAETEPGFLDHLGAQVKQLAPRFTPEKEQQSLKRALALAQQRRTAENRRSSVGE